MKKLPNISKKKTLTLKFVLFIGLFLVFLIIFYQPINITNLPHIFRKESATTTISPDQFDFNEVLEETGSMEESTSSNWWLNSGGLVFNNGETIATIQGNLAPDNKWFKAYQKSTPIETDGGLHPQNILRLVNKNNLQNIRQEAYFKINKTIMSKSPNRNESNGILFFNRYIDGNNLYYAGIRVDGTAVIKKKKDGVYYTLNQQRIYDGKYNNQTNPNLLPENKWIGIKSEVTNLNFKELAIKLFIDKEANGNWELVAEAIDNSNRYGGAAFINAAHNGIRTDFMDIQFKNYSITQL